MSPESISCRAHLSLITTDGLRKLEKRSRDNIWALKLSGHLSCVLDPSHLNPVFVSQWAQINICSSKGCYATELESIFKAKPPHNKITHTSDGDSERPSQISLALPVVTSAARGLTYRKWGHKQLREQVAQRGKGKGRGDSTGVRVHSNRFLYSPPR